VAPIPTVDWATFAAEAPELVRDVTPLLHRARHHVLATLRADGSPRVSGTEVQFVGDELVAGCPADSVKARDVARDGRFALHTNPGDHTMEGGDAKLAGVAELHTDGPLLQALLDQLTADHGGEPAEQGDQQAEHGDEAAEHGDEAAEHGDEAAEHAEDQLDGVALLRLGLTQVTHTALHSDGDRLVIRTWHPGRGIVTVERT
jgi:IS5 family transposase